MNILTGCGTVVRASLCGTYLAGQRVCVDPEVQGRTVGESTQTHNNVLLSLGYHHQMSNTELSGHSGIVFHAVITAKKIYSR